MTNQIELPMYLDDVTLPEKLPPLVLIAFTRPELLKEVMIGISQQSLLPQEIIAFVDGARKTDDQPLIQDCINILNDFSATVPVKIIAREKNLGCDQNIISGLTEVLNNYDSLIYLEDDTVPIPCFYDRMCRLLTAYRDHKQVFSISGYANIPEGLENLIEQDFFVSNRVFCWGFGIWADRWQAIDLINQSGQYNPFGSFYKIPPTVQTKLTIVNQFWLEKNLQTDWMITATIAALYQQKVHIIPKYSLIRNIGFGHIQSKTYRGKEPDWVNSRYDISAYPNSLPSSLEKLEMIKSPLHGQELCQYLAKQKGLWLTPDAILYLWQKYPDLESKISFLKLFINRLPIMLKRLRSRLHI